MEAGLYIVDNGNDSYLMHVSSYANNYEFYFGDATNRHGPCIHIDVDTETPTVASLANVMYSPRCNLMQNMAKGNGTVRMLQTALSVVLKAIPTIQKVNFNDVSSYDCSGKNVWMPYYHLVVHGNTWYEKHFGATLARKKGRERLEKAKDMLKSAPANASFAGFNVPKGCETWHDAFRHWKEKKGCSFFIDNIDEIKKLVGIKLIYSHWYIDANTIASWRVDVKVKKHSKQAGGMPFTRTTGSSKMRLTQEDADY